MLSPYGIDQVFFILLSLDLFIHFIAHIIFRPVLGLEVSKINQQ